MLRRVLSYRLSVEALIELVMWLAIPYVLAGLVWASFHAEMVQQVETRLELRVSGGADLLAYALVGAFWPVELFVSIGTCSV